MHFVSCCLRMLEISWLRFARGGAKRRLQISAQGSASRRGAVLAIPKTKRGTHQIQNNGEDIRSGKRTAIYSCANRRGRGLMAVAKVAERVPYYGLYVERYLRRKVGDLPVRDSGEI